MSERIQKKEEVSQERRPLKDRNKKRSILKEKTKTSQKTSYLRTKS